MTSKAAAISVDEAKQMAAQYLYVDPNTVNSYKRYKKVTCPHTILIRKVRISVTKQGGYLSSL